MTDSSCEPAGNDVITASPRESFQAACRTMSSRNIGCLVVADEAGQLVGIVTERDLIRWMGRGVKKCLPLRLDDFMVRDVQSCPADAPMREVQRRMSDGGIRHLPLVREDEPVGVVSARDVIHWQMAQHEAMRGAAEQVARLWSSIRNLDQEEVLRFVTEEVPRVVGARRSVLCLETPAEDGTISRRVTRWRCVCPEAELLDAHETGISDPCAPFDRLQPAACQRNGAGRCNLRLPLRLTCEAAGKEGAPSSSGYLCLCDMENCDPDDDLIEYKASLLRDTLAANLSRAVLLDKYAAARRAAFHDPLTGLGTRRLFEEKLEQECARSARYHTSFAVALVDIDHFKSINDSLGHAAGDEALTRLGTILSQECRETDTLARHGGDEFILLLPETNGEQAQRLLERIRGRIAADQCDDRPTLTISVGVVGAQDGGVAGGELVRRADMALYQAKRDGRNRVVCWSSLRQVLEKVGPDGRRLDEIRGQIGSLAVQARESFVEGIAGLMRALDARDPFTRSHSEKVTCYAIGIAEQMGIDPEQVQIIRRAALVHDLGMIGVPDSILLKPTPLTEQERAIVRCHPVTALSILDPMSLLRPELPIIHQHHERWDGQGYPDQIAGPRICPGARIVAVADALDAITSARNYRDARPLAEALRIIREGAGTQFAPDVVDALEAWTDSLRAGLVPGTDLTTEALLDATREVALVS
jgi:diguanylate cyclase (GGDEF)-like protein